VKSGRKQGGERVRCEAGAVKVFGKHNWLSSQQLATPTGVQISTPCLVIQLTPSELTVLLMYLFMLSHEIINFQLIHNDIYWH